MQCLGHERGRMRTQLNAITEFLDANARILNAERKCARRQLNAIQRVRLFEYAFVAGHKKAFLNSLPGVPQRAGINQLVR